MSTFTIRYWGTRGSVPVPGKETARYGGNTSCLEVQTEHTRVVVDGGTGLRELGAQMEPPVELTMIFTHLHWDHIQGIPFFPPIYSPGNKIDIISGHKADVSLEAVLRGQMEAPNFPVELTALPAQLSFNEVHHGSTIDLNNVKIRTILLNHPQDATGLRFEAGDKSFVHLTDHEHNDDFEKPIIDFCKGADVLSMDTMYTPDNYERFKGFGHSHWGHAVHIAKEAGVGRLILFHHAPEHSDELMDQIQEQVRKQFPDTDAAYEGMILQI